MDSDKELFSQEISQRNFSIDSILDTIEGSDEPSPQNSCADELKKIVPDRRKHQGWTESDKGCDKDGNHQTKPINFNHCAFVISKDFKLN